MSERMVPQSAALETGAATADRNASTAIHQSSRPRRAEEPLPHRSSPCRASGREHKPSRTLKFDPSTSIAAKLQALHAFKTELHLTLPATGGHPACADREVQRPAGPLPASSARRSTTGSSTLGTCLYAFRERIHLGVTG